MAITAINQLFELIFRGVDWAVLLVMVKFKILNLDTLSYFQICMSPALLITSPPQKHDWTYNNNSDWQSLIQPFLHHSSNFRRKSVNTMRAARYQPEFWHQNVDSNKAYFNTPVFLCFGLDSRKVRKTNCPGPGCKIINLVNLHLFIFSIFVG